MTEKKEKGGITMVMERGSVTALCSVGVVLVLFLCGSAARADLLADDPSAMPGFQGTLTAGYVGGSDRLEVLIDYAVFQPGQYPGDAMNKATEFVYAYQAFNQTASTVALTSYSVGLEADSAAHGIGDDVSAGQPGVAGGISPDISVIGTSSARWGFGWLGGNEIAPDEAGTVLVVSSPNAPVWDTATMMDGGVPTPVGMLPVTRPRTGDDEPARSWGVCAAEAEAEVICRNDPCARVPAMCVGRAWKQASALETRLSRRGRPEGLSQPAILTDERNIVSALWRGKREEEKQA